MGIVAVGSLKDAYYILCRQYGEPCARTSIEKLTELLVIAPTSAEECELSLHGNEPDFEDGLIRACAELNDVDFILTRDARAFARSKVRAVTCAEYLKIRGCWLEGAHPKLHGISLAGRATSCGAGCAAGSQRAEARRRRG